MKQENKFTEYPNTIPLFGNLWMMEESARVAQKRKKKKKEKKRKKRNAHSDNNDSNSYTRNITTIQTFQFIFSFNPVKIRQKEFFDKEKISQEIQGLFD